MEIFFEKLSGELKEHTSINYVGEEDGSIQ